MATNKQISANRQNALKSTGPRSREGKTKSARNAVAHGLRAAEILLPDEDDSVFRQFRQQLFDHFTPANILEAELVDRMTQHLWRLRRCRRIEAGLFGGVAQVADRAMVDLSLVGARKEKKLNPLTYDISLAFSVVESESEMLTKLARYEAGLDRAFYRCLHELQRLQALRMESATIVTVNAGPECQH